MPLRARLSHEAAGMIFNPAKPYEYVVAVQHTGAKARPVKPR